MTIIASKMASTDGTNFHERVTVHPGDVVTFGIIVRSIEAQEVNYVVIKDTLPEWLKIVEGETTIEYSWSDQVTQLADTIATNGFSLGPLKPDTTQYITYKAKVDDALKEEGINFLPLTYWEGSSRDADDVEMDFDSVIIERRLNELNQSTQGAMLPSNFNEDIYATYLGHSGFMLETPTATMLFDWWQGDLPEIRADVPLYVFISHTHPDHFRWDALWLATVYPECEIFFGYDELDIELNKKLHSTGDTIESAIEFVEGGQTTYSLDKKVQIECLNSTDLGVAFLVRVDGKTIFHAGDLAMWIRPDLGYNYEKMEQALRCYISPLRGRTIDYGMLPIEINSLERQDTIANYLSAAKFKAWSPMHFGGKYELIEPFIAANSELAKNMIAVTNSSGVKKAITPGVRYRIE